MGIGLFDILGPITVGPSSSHTAGAVRLGLVCRRLLGSDVKQAKITFYGSFAETYKGHGTEKAVIGGLLGFLPDNEKIRESLALAEFRGLQYQIFTAEDLRLHPNTVLIEAASKERNLRMMGASVGGGAVCVTEINGMEVEASFEEDTVILFHRDAPGVLAGIAHVLTSCGYNIGNLRLSRTRREGDVITVVETDVPVDEETLERLLEVESVSDAIMIPRF
ncbi:MAG: L-serine ammonia-lyase, iron-sulfur-dependent subunit beta [Clostridia bacterium]|nr:L-serine ammonia-lyase, iron-sulfur-dependent subunit beta [Clostridia bacterium]